MPEQGSRIVAAGALAAVLAAGMFLSGKTSADSRERVSELESHAVSLDDALAEIAAREQAERFDTESFMAQVRTDAERFGVEPPSKEELAAPFARVDALTDAVTIGPRKSWSSKHVRIRVDIDKVSYQQHGAMVSAKHTIAIIENISDTPIAYFARVASAERGHCEIRGARMLNAMALEPGEEAQMVVCAGRGRVRLLDLQVMEISKLAHRYLSQVPPEAVGYDPVVGSAHEPLDRVRMCESIDTKQLSYSIRQGETAWADVIDFYARHNCHYFEFPYGYRVTDVPLTRLPVVPRGAKG